MFNIVLYSIVLLALVQFWLGRVIAPDSCEQQY